MIRTLASAAAVALTLAAPATADTPDRISILLGSKHIGANGFNEVNPGIFLTWEGDTVDWTLGAFHNSYGKPSIAGTAYIALTEWEGGEAGAFAGIAYYPEDGRRHKAHIGDLVPIAGLQARHGHTFIQFTPMNGKPVDALLSFGLTFPLN